MSTGTDDTRTPAPLPVRRPGAVPPSEPTTVPSPTPPSPTVPADDQLLGSPLLEADLAGLPDVYDPDDWRGETPFADQFPLAGVEIPFPAWLRVVHDIHMAARKVTTMVADGAALALAGLLVRVQPPDRAFLAAFAIMLACYLGRVYGDRDTVQTKGLSWYPGRIVLPISLVVLGGLASHRLSAEEAVRLAPAAFATLVGLRCLTWAVIVTCRRRGVGLVRTLVVGEGESLRVLARKLRSYPESGLGAIGAIPLSKLLTDNGLSEAIRVVGAEHVVLVPQLGDETAMAASLRRCSGVDASFSMVPPMAELFLHPRSTNEVGGLPLVPLGRILQGRATFPGKRALDLLVASLALLLLSPLLVAVAVAIKLTDGGPVLYRQQRVGRFGKPFQMVKLRSMVVDADRLLDDLQEHNLTDGLLFKMKDDPRVTRVGRFIRRTSIDELPQLWNVLTGDMSVVGPRPLPVDPSSFTAIENERHSVPPGITGYWQISGGTDLSYDEMVRLDLAYLQSWSLLLDVRLMIKTVPALLHRHGTS